LRYYEDLTVDDIAATLQISSGTVKRYLSDALGRMAVGLDRTESSDRGSHRG
jgi:DNA-directed RNA polymerase specialized sigma24 family protein